MERLEKKKTITPEINEHWETQIADSVSITSHLQVEIRDIISKIESKSLKKSEFTSFIEDANERCETLLHVLTQTADSITNFRMKIFGQNNDQQ